MWETWVQSLGWEDPLEEGMATHSSILAWRISMDREAWWAIVQGLQRVRYEWATKHSFPLYGTTFYLSHHLLMDIWVSNFWILWIFFEHSCARFLSWTCIFISLVSVPRSRIAIPHGISMLSILQSCQTDFQSSYTPLYFPTGLAWGFHFLYILIALVVSLNFRHPNGCEMVSHLVLICISIMIYWASVHILIGQFSLEKCLLNP